MAVSPILTDLDATVTRTTTAMASGAAFIRGVSGLIATAVAAAMANGATAAELEPVKALGLALDTSTADLSAAIVENTAAAGEPPA